jgi:hypothetical protein
MELQPGLERFLLEPPARFPVVAAERRAINASPGCRPDLRQLIEIAAETIFIDADGRMWVHG